MRKVSKGQRYIEYGNGHREFVVVRVVGHNTYTNRGTVISTSRLMTCRYYKLLSK